MRFFLLFFILTDFSWTACFSTVLAQEQVMPQEAIPTESSNHKVKIKIFAKGSGKKIKRVEVQINKERLYTDQNGEIEISVPEGQGQIGIAKYGFETLYITYDQLRQNASFETFLYPGVPNDNEVIIRGQKRQEVSRKTFTSSEAARVAQGGDPVQVAKLLPGVQSSPFQPDPIVRGSGPNDTRYFVDHIEVPLIYHRIGNISIFPEQLIDDVEFSSGGFGPQYGDATGGIIALKTKSDVPENNKTDVRVNLPIYSAAFHEHVLNDHQSLAISYRRSYLEYLLRYFMRRSGGNLTVVPFFEDAHLMFLDKQDDGYTKILTFAADDGLKLVLPSPEADNEQGHGKLDFYSGFATLAVEKYQNLGGHWSYTATPQYTYFRERAEILDLKVAIDSYVFRVHSEFAKKLSNDQFFYVGLQPTYTRSIINLLVPAPSADQFFDFEEAPRITINRTLEQNDVAVWTAIDQVFGSLVLTPGVRFFQHSNLKKPGVDPRLNAKLQLDTANKLKAAVGQYSIAPEIQESNDDYGNPDLDYEKSMHYIAGLETRWSDRWETDFQIFYKRTINLIFPDDERKFIGNGLRISRGFEAFIRRNLTEKLFGWLSYTYSMTEERKNAQEEFYPGAYDQTHVGNLAGSYRVTSTWDLGLRFTYHTGDTYTPITDSVYNSGLDKYQPRQDNVKQNSERLPNYHNLDVFATKDFLMDHWKLALRFGVLFLATKKQAFGVRYNYDYSEEQYFTGIPPIPFVEVRGEF